MTASGIRSGVHIVDVWPVCDHCRSIGCITSTCFMDGLRDGPDYIATLRGAFEGGLSGYAETA